jgi:subtilisin family serine protease
MNWKRIFWGVISVLVLAALVAPSRLAGATSQQPGAHFVRLPVAASVAFDQLGLRPRADLDYGAFRWLELSDADFGVLSASALAYTPVADGGTINVMRYRFDPAVNGEPAVPYGLKALGEGSSLRLVQFTGPVQDAWLGQLGAAGMDVLQYYPSNTYLVWATPAQAETITAQPFVRWQGTFHPAYKLSQTLAGMTGRIEAVAITFYNDGHLSATLANIVALGGGYVQHFPAQPDKRFYTAIFTLDAAAIEAVARLAPVWAIEYSATQPGLDDENGAQIIAGNYPGGTPETGYYDWLAEKGVSGAGITWADVDTGLNSSHPDITGRAVAYVNYGSPANQDPDGHGSHTAGAIFGDPLDATHDGKLDPNGFYWGVGAAPSSLLVVQNALMDSSWPPAGGWQVLSKDSITNGAIGSSNSWYTGATGAQGYSAACRTHDLMVRDGNFDTTLVAEPIIMVFSAGNAGPGASTLTEPKEAKNLITVGASDNYPRSGSSVNGLASFSSRGPALDGRLLPNVTAPGVNTVSFNGSGSATCGSLVSGPGAAYYNYCQGTSMAAPFVSGASALIADWWNQEYGVDPSPAMVKALLINGAADMFGGSNVNGHIPNNNQGWGRINLNNVIRNGVDNIYSDQEILFHTTGESSTLSFGVSDPTQPLKVTLVWVDAPGAAGANPALVNNLDLTVVNGADTYYGNNFTNGWSVPGGSVDVLNNIESVYIQNPTSSAVITIDATAINADGVPYNGDTTDQDFALVCYNCVLKPDFTLAASPSQQSVCAPDTAVYSVDLGQIWTFAQPVALTAPSLPADLVATFDPNPVIVPGTAVFSVTNTISATAGLYLIRVEGSAITLTHSVTVGLELFSGLPSVPELLYPAAEARTISVLPIFTWQAEQSQLYDIEIATDAAFTNIVASGSGLATATFTPASALAQNTIYYWHVRASNTCGDSSWSPARRFLTEAGIAQCALGTTPITLLSQDFEGDVTSWSTGGTGSTWAASTTRKHGGAFSYKAIDEADITDQWLISPAVTLPSSQSPLNISFWNYRKFQTPGCADGSVLEVSSDGGTTWISLDSQLQSDPYEGVIDSSTNPLYGQNAWCGSHTSWLNAVASLDEFAGQAVQFRFRVGTDDSIGYEGWYVDDVTVQSCAPSAALLADTTLEAEAGEAITFTFTLANQSALDEVYALSLVGADWPTTIVSANPITVTSGTTVTLQVRVDVPAGTGGATETFGLQAASQNVPGILLEVSGTLNVAEVQAPLQLYLPLLKK